MHTTLINFYPRPPRGGRPLLALKTIRTRLFLSTPSARRATRGNIRREDAALNFYPRPPRGGRRSAVVVDKSLSIISIHALREEGDPFHSDVRRWQGQFLSTPSARRATAVCSALNSSSAISIHALREEGDISSRTPLMQPSNFYPRPPRGGRPRRKRGLFPAKQISIHALREEGDGIAACSVSFAYSFLSTPSARRAT